MEKLDYPATTSAIDVPIWGGIPDRSPASERQDLGGHGAFGALLDGILKVLGLGPLRDRQQD